MAERVTTADHTTAQRSRRGLLTAAVGAADAWALSGNSSKSRGVNGNSTDGEGVHGESIRSAT